MFSKFIHVLVTMLLVNISAATNASLLDDDSVEYTIDLMTTSGNSIVASDTFGPRDDLFCIDAQIGGTCPPGPLYEVYIGNNGPVGTLGFDGNDMLAAIEVGALGQFTLVVLDLLFTPGTPEQIWGSFSFSDLGWGAEQGRVASVINSGGTSTFTDTSMTITIVEQDAITMDVTPDNLSRISVFFNLAVAEHVSVPVPSSILLLGLSLAGLCWSRRKYARLIG